MTEDSEGPGKAPDEKQEPVLVDHRRLIGQRFYVYTWVRAVVAVTIVAAAFFARYVLGMPGLDVNSLTILALWIVVYNTLSWGLFRGYRDPEVKAPDYRRLLTVTYAAVVIDFLTVTVAVWLVGGARSPFVAFYLLHVTVSCILLSRRSALALTTLAYLLLVLLVIVEWTGLATPRLPVGAVAGVGVLGSRFALTIVVVYGMLFTLSTYVLLGLTRSRRRVERRILLANAELNRLSEQRKSFLHIAVHNLKAPVGAVSMMLDNMKNGLAGDVTEKQRNWLDRSLRRLKGLTDFMADLQTLSSLDTDIIQGVFGPVDVPAIAERLVEEYRDVADAHQQQLTLHVPGPVPPVVGHDRLLQEAIVNYLTNALKYTPEGGEISVRVLYRAPLVRVEVTDNGIGVASEDQGRLFREFVRLPTKGTAVETVSGSGLGLSIVRRIGLAHGGRVGIESEDGEGSTFFLELPALHE